MALEGELDIHAGRQRMALLREGEAIKLEPRIAHRIHQHGAGPGTSGAALWPGAVEKAFRELSVAALQKVYQRSI